MWTPRKQKLTLPVAIGLCVVATYIVATAHEAHENKKVTQQINAGHWTAPDEAARKPNPVQAKADSFQRGKAIYKQYCVSCHGPQGRGDGPVALALDPRPADLAVLANHHPPGDLAWKIGEGRGAMPPWKGVINETQIWDVVNYLKSLPSVDMHKSSEGDSQKRNMPVRR